MSGSIRNTGPSTACVSGVDCFFLKVLRISGPSSTRGRDRPEHGDIAQETPGPQPALIRTIQGDVLTSESGDSRCSVGVGGGILGFERLVQVGSLFHILQARRLRAHRHRLIRHEIAYVFGQLSSSDSVPALLEVLRNPNEVDMVRHEAAEALGSIAEPDLIPILEEYRSKGPRVVKESCEVALDMAQYELAGEFQYADGLTA